MASSFHWRVEAMTLIQGMVRLLYTERKVDHFEQDVEEWVTNHEPILDSLAWQDLIRDANKLFEDIQRLDRDLRLLHANGMPFHEELDEKIPALVKRWQQITCRFLPHLDRLVALGAHFHGFAELRSHCEEAEELKASEEMVVLQSVRLFR